MSLIYIIAVLVVLRIVAYWLFPTSSDDESALGKIKSVGRFLYYVLTILAVLFLLGFGAVIYRIITGEFPI